MCTARPPQQDEAVVIGCQTGVLIYSGGTITKVASPTEYGRIGNQAGSEESAVTLGDYKKDKDAELERPEQISLINTKTKELLWWTWGPATASGRWPAARTVRPWCWAPTAPCT